MDSLNRNSVALVLQPIDTVTAGDLTSAAATVLATFACPPSGLFTRDNYFQYGWEILGIQMIASQTLSGGGTAGVVGLYINGTESQVTVGSTATNWSRLAHTNTALTKGKVVNASVLGVYNLQLDVPGAAEFTAISGASWYPVSVAKDNIEVRVITQGTVGTMTYWFQLFVRPALFQQS